MIVCIGTIFRVKGVEYVITNFGGMNGCPCWYFRTLRDNGKEFIMGKKDLKRKLELYKNENKHLLEDTCLRKFTK